MLHIECTTWEKLENRRDFIRSPDATFDGWYKDEWLESDFGRKIITELEQIPMIYPSVKMSIHAVCAVSQISTGGKNLFLCKYLDRKNLLTRMGDNCFPYLMDIAEEKDVYMIATSYRTFTDEILRGRSIYLEDLGILVSNQNDYMSAMIKVRLAGLWGDFDEIDED